jgi:hypothetical protein
MFTPSLGDGAVPAVVTRLLQSPEDSNGDRTYDRVRLHGEHSSDEVFLHARESDAVTVERLRLRGLVAAYEHHCYIGSCQCARDVKETQSS